MPADESIVRIENVVKEFGPLRVLDGVGFDVARGQTVAVVGRSGSGKSTLLRCIAGLETVQGGRIEVCGHEVGRPGSAARAQLRRDVGMVFQSYNLFPHLTVERNITLALTLVKKESKEAARKRAGDVLALVVAARTAHEEAGGGVDIAQLGEAIQQASAVELSNIVSNSLDAKYAFAF